MMRISKLEAAPGSVVLRVEGQLVGTAVEELERACGDAAGLTADRVDLDVAELAFADRRGIECLRRLRARGVTLTRCTPFVAEQLKEVGSC